MVLEFFSSPVGIAAILSFFISSFGYVIVRMWIQPMWQYRRLKARVRALLEAVEDLPENAGASAFPGKDIRQVAARLTDCYNKTLPQWYQLMLSNRNESPTDAVADLMSLANVKDRRHANKRITGVRTALGITPNRKKG